MEPGQDSIRFLVKLARGLHMHGTPAHRIEAALEVATARLGIPSQFFALPTVILAAFGLPEQRSTGLIRVVPGGVHLEKLVLLDDVLKDLLDGRTTADAAAQRVDEIEQLPARYGPAARTVAFAVAAACAACFSGGGLREVAVAAVLGIVPCLLEPLRRVRAGFERVHVPLAAFAVSFLALIAAGRFGPLSTYVVTVSALIVLLPGLALTMAISELAAQSLVSGTVRLVAAAVVFLELAFGVALGRALAAAWFAPSDVVEPQRLPAAAQLVALVLASAAFTVLFRARPRDLGPILATGALGFAAGQLGALLLEGGLAAADLGTFAAAFVVGSASNLYARFLDRPLAVAVMPGILLLVPGSIGFRGLTLLLDRDVVSGVEAAFRMMFTAAAIVAGLLFSSVAAPTRRTF